MTYPTSGHVRINRHDTSANLNATTFHTHAPSYPPTAPPASYYTSPSRPAVAPQHRCYTAPIRRTDVHIVQPPRYERIPTYVHTPGYYNADPFYVDTFFDNNIGNNPVAIFLFCIFIILLFICLLSSV